MNPFLIVALGIVALVVLSPRQAQGPAPVKNPQTPQGGPTSGDQSTSPGTVAGQGDTSGNPGATPMPVSRGGGNTVQPGMGTFNKLDPNVTAAFDMQTPLTQWTRNS